MPEAIPVPRGSMEFLVTQDGDLVNLATHVNLLRQLWLDRKLILGDDLGPGDQGDFDFGAWHSSCHLVAAGGARRTADGRVVWLEISHLGTRDEYYASATVKNGPAVATVPIDSAEGRTLLANSTLLGFVEGNSAGRTSARFVFDEPDRFNLWRRQDFDQPTSSKLDGGKVWEHWCTLRDLRPHNRVGLSVLSAYIALTAALGDKFAAAVLRGRRDYSHPQQLCALVHAGFIGNNAALWDSTPHAIPSAAESLFLEATPTSGLAAAELLEWGTEPRYYMFGRKIGSWSAAKDVKADLKKFAVKK